MYILRYLESKLWSVKLKNGKILRLKLLTKKNKSSNLSYKTNKLFKEWVNKNVVYRTKKIVWYKNINYYKRLINKLAKNYKMKNNRWQSNYETLKFVKKHLKLSLKRNKIKLKNLKMVCENFKTSPLLKIHLISYKNFNMDLTYMTCIRQMEKINIVDLLEMLEMIYAANFQIKINTSKIV